MATEESNQVLAVLEEKVRSSRFSVRSIERRLGMSQGYLSSMFRGRIQLRVSHVYSVARVLELEPLSLFLTATPPKDPNWLLKELGIDPEKQRPPTALLAYLQGSPMDREEIRQIIREEVGRLLRPDGGGS